MGGKIHWRDVLEFHGYRLQQHVTLGIAWNHHRLLDPNDKCVLFTFKISELRNTLDE